MLEALGTAVKGVRDLGLDAIGGVVQERPDIGAPAAAEGRDRPVVLLVHGQHVVELLAVLRSEPAGPLGSEVQPSPPGALLSPRVRGFSYVVRVGPGGVDGDLTIKPLAPHEILEDTLCDRGPANVSHADEQDSYHGSYYTF